MGSFAKNLLGAITKLYVSRKSDRNYQF